MNLSNYMLPIFGVVAAIVFIIEAAVGLATWNESIIDIATLAVLAVGGFVLIKGYQKRKSR